MAFPRERMLTDEEVYECRLRYMMGESMPALGREKGVSRTVIKCAVRGWTYKHCTRVPPVLPGVRNMHRKVSPSLVLKLRAERARGGKIKRMARREGLSFSTMHRLLRGHTYKWVS